MGSKKTGLKIENNFNKLLQNKMYFVDDIINSNIKILFVLESPHKDEIRCGYPLAGKSGVNMTKLICKVLGVNNPNICNKVVPFGKLLKDTYDIKISDSDFKNDYGDIRVDFKKIGIMNVCNIPMQMSAYCCDDIKKYCKEIRSLESIRNRPQTKKYKDFLTENIHKILKSYFCNKINPYLCNSCTIIPLGKVAYEFINKCNCKNKKSLIKDHNGEVIQHPAKWSNDYIKNLAEYFKNKKIL